MMIAAVLYSVEAFRSDILTMAKPTVIYRKEGRVAHVILNRPETGNAIDQSMAWGLQDAARSMIEDDDITVGIIRGAGDAFCNGSDPLTPPTDTLASRRVAQALAEVPKPTIAAINGDALGQGLEIALACDLRIAVQGARLGLDQVRGGAMPWDGGTQRLPRMASRGTAMEMILLGRLLTAEEAYAAGLVMEVVAEDELEKRCDALAQELASAAPLANAYAKEAMHKGMDMPLDQALRLEADLAILLHTSSDRAEGLKSFLEKRSPNFTGR